MGKETKYRIHLVLLSVQGSGEPGDEEKQEVLVTEGLAGYPDDFAEEEEAVRVFEAFSAVKVNSQ